MINRPNRPPEPSMYCPVCGRWVDPEWADRYDASMIGEVIYLHDEIDHDDDDIDAFILGVQ